MAWWRSRNGEASAASTSCRSLHALWSEFVDAFVHTSHSRGLQASPARAVRTKTCPWRSGGVLPAKGRVVAVGDVHGDLVKLRQAMRLAGVTDERDRWIGGDAVVVQVGDQLDRGDDEVAVLYFLEKLKREADRAGGAVVVLNGNHETMNVGGRFRYATEESAVEFQTWRHMQLVGKALKQSCGVEQGRCDPGKVEKLLDGMHQRWAARYAALRPGGPLATRFLAQNPVAVQVGNTLFVHGGLLPEHCEYGLHRINQEIREWMLGNTGSAEQPDLVRGRNSLVWARHYSHVEESKCDCEVLKEALQKMDGVDRVVVGHTVQQPGGISTACDGKVIRVDVGMSKGVADARPEVRERRGEMGFACIECVAKDEVVADSVVETQLSLRGMRMSFCLDH